ncbi:hypothetical protein OU798_07565 [Prolixibacteraceae bacterium Z1-6]|uniref:Uncharacterized protein n=1 Tax=Draconibacterium aestuarii TaxID=2998507 RepID=A0A9X3J707_9BACT|nr:hypothetical protein [Prolixibacteraceae bacterium Z1-6]
MLVIPQAKPDAGYFKVFVPGNTDVHHNDTVECKDPDSGETVRGICRSIITIYWTEVPGWICHETYGCGAYELKKKLEAELPSFRGQDEIKILIIKQN